MYKIVKERRAWWWVIFNGVTEEGRVVENKIELRFFVHDEVKHLSLTAEATKLEGRAHELVNADLDLEASGRKIEELSEAEAGELLLAKLPVLWAEFAAKIACDWRGVGGENGEPLRWEPDNIALLMAVPGVFQAVLDGYRRCRLGDKDARAGN